MNVNRVGTTQKHEASVNHFHDLVTWEAQTFSLKTPAEHTTENPNWDIVYSAKRKKYTGKKEPSERKHVKSFAISSEL